MEIETHLDPLGSFKFNSQSVGSRDLGSYENVRFWTQMAWDSSYGGREGRGLAVVELHIVVLS
eukprot:CCRYP_015883-RA/>CCRYP_015883-RA protein AED:0.47 eAED:0.49 QI:0/0/0.5/1/0/0/2/240/62